MKSGGRAGRNDALSDLRRERLAAADRIDGIGIEHGDDAVGVAAIV